MPRNMLSRVMKGLGATSFSTFLQLPFNMQLFRRMPMGVCRFYLGLLGSLYFALASGERRAVRRALDHCFARAGGPRKGRGAWARVKAGIIDHYHEKIFVAFKPYDKMKRFLCKRVKITGQEALEAALAQGRGVVLVTGHFGAVEFLPPALAFSGRALTAMVHCNSPSLRRILERRAARAGVDILDPKSRSIIFSALEHLKKGRILITQCDEIDMWRPYRDRSINFLGLEVGLDRSMDILIRKSKAPVVFGLMHRRGRGRYELALTTPRPRAGGSRPESVGAACLRMLGDEIYNCPSAWYEWKKLRSFLPPSPRTEPHADRRSMRLFSQVGLHVPRGA